MLIRTYTTAAVVEKIVEGLMQNRASSDVYSKPYQNGRENGFVFCGLKLDGPNVFVTENRNSDDIQCVVSKSDTMFNEEEYRKAKYFRFDEHVKAAKFVLESVLGKNWWAPKEAAEG